jgi:hypothetical protein
MQLENGVGGATRNLGPRLVVLDNGWSEIVARGFRKAIGHLERTR